MKLILCILTYVNRVTIKTVHNYKKYDKIEKKILCE